jgi:hypothetical protein
MYNTTNMPLMLTDAPRPLLLTNEPHSHSARMMSEQNLALLAALAWHLGQTGVVTGSAPRSSADWAAEVASCMATLVSTVTALPTERTTEQNSALLYAWHLGQTNVVTGVSPMRAEPGYTSCSMQ